MEIIDKSDVSPEEIGSYVRRHPGVSVFQTPEFLRVLDATESYKGGWLGLRDSGKLVGSLVYYDIIDRTPIPGFSISRRIVMGGPIVDFGDAEERDERLKELLSGLIADCRKSIMIEVRNLFDVTEFAGAFESQGFKSEGHLNFLIDLTKGEENLLEGMTSSGRRMVKKSLKEGLTATFAKNREEVDSFYSILSSSYEKKGLPIADISLFRACFEILGDGHCRFILAKDKEGKIVAGRLELLEGGTMYDWYAAADPAYLSQRPNELLVWSSLIEGMKLGMSTFDFGGAGRPDEEYGVRDFKEKFGGKQVDFGRYVLVTKKLKMGLASKGYKLRKRVRSRS